MFGHSQGGALIFVLLRVWRSSECRVPSRAVVFVASYANCNWKGTCRLRESLIASSNRNNALKAVFAME